MSVLRTEIRRGAYRDSIVLMQLQSALQDLPGILEAGVVMATEANLEQLESRGLRPSGENLAPEDLLVVVKALTAEAATEALGRIDGLLERRRATVASAYRPHTVEAAVQQAPEATWVSVSVPGQYAAAVARQALDLGRHVFLYSDNVPLEEEVALKRQAAESGLLVLGPDCGTAIVGGVGLGFANRVREGSVGMVAASGTGLQAVASELDRRGCGVAHAVGTGGRDLSAAVGGLSTLQGMAALRACPEVEVLVLISKPPDEQVSRRILGAALGFGRPVVVAFLGLAPPARRLGRLHFATDLWDAAALAAELAAEGRGERSAPRPDGEHGRRRFVRGLFSGGTLALQTLQALRPFLQPLASNLEADGVEKLAEVSRSVGHTILDLGADELTVGRPHPMIDSRLRLERLAQEARDEEVSVLLLDLVLGDGAHPDPGPELAAALSAERESGVEACVLLVGTEEDPQDLSRQEEVLRQAGALVFRDPAAMLGHVLERLGPRPAPEPALAAPVLERPAAVVNVGLELFFESVSSQGVLCVDLDWRPPAGGNPRLMSILERMKG